MDTLAQDIARTFGTPAHVIDLDKVERNIARLQAACDKAGIANRPHIKTHKSPLLAAMQRDAGAKGITCQKLGEAEIMADAGLDDILVSYNLLGEEKQARLAALMQRVNITVVADNPVVVEGLAKAAADAGRSLDVLVECDTGRKRTGVETPAEAITLARIIEAQPTLNFAGLLLYPPEQNTTQTRAFLDATASLAPRIVSTGGTPNVADLDRLAGVTEHRAGTYLFNDRMMLACGAASLDECALYVVSRVVSRAAPERGCLDAGSKTLSSDTGGLEGYGLLLEYPRVKIAKFSEEHGVLDLSESNERPEIGELVRIIPNHVCVTVNMVDRLIATRGGAIVGEIPVAARGRIL